MTSMERDSNDVLEFRGKRVWVAGHTGLVGSALVRRLQSENILLITAPHGAVDLTRQAETEEFVRQQRPQVVFLAAALVGGILANDRFPVDFLYDNLMISANVIRAAHSVGVEKLVCFGSSCIYPRDAPQPMREDMLLTGPLEKTNEAYAVAKIAGLKLAEAYARQHGDHFVTVMPTNLYGRNDNFDLETAHVLPALIRKLHDARRSGASTVTLWGSGTPMREFLHVDDLADACILIAQRYHHAAPINVGSGLEISIRDLARLVAGVVGFKGSIEFDRTKPDGTPRKLVERSKLDAFGWRPRISLEDGVRDLYLRWRATQAGIGERRGVTLVS